MLTYSSKISHLNIEMRLAYRFQGDYIYSAWVSWLY